MEQNRSAFKQPSSVTKVGIAAGSDPAKLATSTTQNVVYEYFKTGHVPEEYDESPLSTPTNFKVTYNDSTNKVSMSWRAVSPSPNAKDSYGKLGYNVYKDGVLLDWTDKTSYSFETTSPYSTYTVIATYKSYSGIQSSAASYTLKEKTITPTPSATPTPSPSAIPTPDPSSPPTTDKE